MFSLEQGNNSRLSLPTWLPRNVPAPLANTEAGVQRPQSSIAHVNLGPGATTFIVTDRGGGASPVRPPAPQGLTTSASNDSNLSDMAAEHPEINISVNPANNNNIHDNADNESQSDDGNQQVSSDP